MKKIVRALLSSIVGLIVFVAKADISSASTIMLYQPKLPENEAELK